MKTQLILGALLTFTSLYYLQNSGLQSNQIITGLENNPDYDKFMEYMQKYQKSYGGVDEMIHRFKVFCKNLKLINEHNSQNADLQMGENQFMDLEYSEFKALMLNGHNRHEKGLLHHKNSDKVRYLNITDLPKEVDWRGKAVTQVKNQGTCGGCWAFSTAGALEGAFAVKQKEIKDFSVQQIIDCCRINLYGCNGGDPIVAFQECILRDGIMHEKKYPFTESAGDCFYNEQLIEFKPKDYAIVPQSNTQQLMMALTLQPISVCISDGAIFHFYNKGILDHGNCGDDQDHCVLLVGYGTEEQSGKDYWILKNSWGEQWGEKGYIRIRRDPEGPNLCGVAVEPSYVVY